ncbi:hypothetical protein KIH39_08905 [Telmatocola sphagniphila]|uniref:Uncharacterized protein n=1 Tax=Telmatocola sphagniphila TaxID=1123043 RepID=A0A8E6B9S9_9BACT|nr:hypothetical protein [Telmatocola sphagniphila]QVL34007.1 hypothetical protein KIH39_08905 [Telmatocola sphagniphila]
MFRVLKLSCAAAVCVLGLSVGNSAKADECGCGYVMKKITICEPVVCYETRQVPYQACITQYDHCGKAYETHVTRYREVQIKVTKERHVTKYVKVPTHY